MRKWKNVRMTYVNITLMTTQGSDTETSIFKCNSSKRSQVHACGKWPNFHRPLKYWFQFHGIRVFR